MPKPLAWLNTRVGIADGLAIYFHFHFINFDARDCVVGDVKVAVERRQLLELNFVDHCALLVGHRQLKRPVLLAPKVFHSPLHPPL